MAKLFWNQRSEVANDLFVKKNLSFPKLTTKCKNHSKKIKENKFDRARSELGNPHKHQT